MVESHQLVPPEHAYVWHMRTGQKTRHLTMTRKTFRATMLLVMTNVRKGDASASIVS